MEVLALKQSNVVFDSEHHTYTLDGKELSGVTPIVKWLFPDTYKGIPDRVLMAAANYGTLIHTKCELADSMGIVQDDIVEQYQRITQEAGLEVSCSEYLVSDEKSIASCIDKVYRDDSLGDIKTTSQVHIVNVQVQLSIYAWLYELQTGRKANRLFLVWLPKPQYGKPAVRELERIPAEICKYVVEIYVNGGEPLDAMAAISPYLMADDADNKRVAGEVPDDWDDVIAELMTVKKQLDFYTQREKELKSCLLTAMECKGEDKWSNDLIQLSRRAASERVSIDTKALQAAEPQTYEKFKKVTKVAASLTYKLL